jgi:hypothetical protein
MLWVFTLCIVAAIAVFDGFESVLAQLGDMAWWIALLTIFTAYGFIRWLKQNKPYNANQ